MAKIFINLNHVSDPVEGWTASVAQAHGAVGAPNEVAIGESVIYPTKEAAWNSIQQRVQRLDFKNDEIYFNGKRVYSYQEVLDLVNAL